MRKTCHKCKAGYWRYCELAFKTETNDGIMRPLEKCPKPITKANLIKANAEYVERLKYQEERDGKEN